MGKKRSRKPQPKQKWYNQIASYPIFGIPTGTWLLILFLFLCAAGTFYVTIIFDAEDVPAEPEEPIAEVSDLWTEQYDDETGGFMVYRVRLKQDEGEFTCTVSPVLVRLWRELEIGTTYKLSINRTRSRCFITEATVQDDEFFND